MIVSLIVFIVVEVVAIGMIALITLNELKEGKFRGCIQKPKNASAWRMIA